MLDHPHRAVSRSVPLAFPESVVRVDGNWTSRDQAYVSVESVPGGLAVELYSGEQ
jgi:hypothetical protein